MSTDTRTAQPQAATPTSPHDPLPNLPIIAFHKGKSPLAVYYSTTAAASAKSTYPRDSFFDMNGAALTLVQATDGTPDLVAGPAGNLAKLTKRVLDVLRKAATRAYPRGTPAEFEAVFAWLSSAPTFEDMVNGLGLTETHPHPTTTVNIRGCKSCTQKQRLAWGVPPCCPG